MSFTIENVNGFRRRTPEQSCIRGWADRPPPFEAKSRSRAARMETFSRLDGHVLLSFVNASFRRTRVWCYLVRVLLRDVSVCRRLRRRLYRATLDRLDAASRHRARAAHRRGVAWHFRRPAQRHGASRVQARAHAL